MKLLHFGPFSARKQFCEPRSHRAYEAAVLESAPDKLTGEAGLFVRDSLRAARHAILLGRQFVSEADPVRLGRFAVLRRVDRLAEEAVGTASRLAHAAFNLFESRNPLHLPCAAERFLETGPDSARISKIAFAHAGYEALRRSLKLLGTPHALVMETRIEGAFLAALDAARQQGLRPLVFSAALSWELMDRHAIVHLALPGAASAEPHRDADALAQRACFALGLAIAAASCQGVPEEEADSLLGSACEMSLALGEEVSSVGGRPDIERLFASYAPHV